MAEVVEAEVGAAGDYAGVLEALHMLPCCMCWPLVLGKTRPLSPGRANRSMWSRRNGTKWGGMPTRSVSPIPSHDLSPRIGPPDQTS